MSSAAPEQPQQDLLESNVSSNKVDQQQQQQQQREPKRYKFKSKTDFIGKVSGGGGGIGGDNTQTQADEDEEDEANENSKPVSEPTTVAALEIGMTIQERLDYKTLGKIRNENEYNSSPRLIEKGEYNFF